MAETPYQIKIPTRNVFYILSYAYDAVKQKEFEGLGEEEHENILELFADILIRGLSAQVARGIFKDYTPYEEALAGLRGKIEINESIRIKSQLGRKLHCKYDEFSPNNLFNQILKTSCLLLLQRELVNPAKRRKIKRLMAYLGDVNEIQLKTVQWVTLCYQKSNMSYRLLIYICYLLYVGLDKEFKDDNEKLIYMKNEVWARLYDKFVYEFFKKECKHLKVQYQGQIVLDDPEAEDSISAMEAAISLTGKDSKLIINTKLDHYRMEHQYGEEDKVIMIQNLRQLNRSMLNSPFNKEGRVEGMLLYPTIEERYFDTYDIAGHRMHICSLDMSDDFEMIKGKLMQISEIVT